MAIHANSTLMSGREVMKRAWGNYRLMTAPGAAFSRRMFAAALRNAWYSAKLEAQIIADRAEEQADQTDMEREIANLSYLPLHMDAGRREREIRARYALAA